jgi:alkanesulfonate monooxygenase SsuD/methylene tetrahydromethanopterin reductase-like flavin-dependent oxidoreductase (luciferase family)
VTSRIGFHTSVWKLPLRHPVLAAKDISTLAVLSNDRLTLGVGLSPWSDDYEICEVPWERRGERLRESIEIIRGLSTGEYFGYEGECYRFREIKLCPVPTQPIPVIVGGHSDRSLRRAAEWGDGWITADLDESALAERIATLTKLLEEAGRSPNGFQIYSRWHPPFTQDRVRRFAEMGVTHLAGGITRVDPYKKGSEVEPLQERVDNLRRYADAVALVPPA